jgi:5-oxoprolinase (ATP-hydrolysing)
MGIAEQMGRVLQRTSISVNIKERLDFSCALFGPDGEAMYGAAAHGAAAAAAI